MGDVSPAQVQDYLEGVDYPANKTDLKKHARGQGADQKIVELINNLPEKDYNSPIEVTKAIGQIV